MHTHVHAYRQSWTEAIINTIHRKYLARKHLANKQQSVHMPYMFFVHLWILVRKILANSSPFAKFANFSPTKIFLCTVTGTRLVKKSVILCISLPSDSAAFWGNYHWQPCTVTWAMNSNFSPHNGRQQWLYKTKGLLLYTIRWISVNNKIILAKNFVTL